MHLFLDFDGVLHPNEVYLERGRPVLRSGGTLFMWGHFLVEMLADLPEVRIVLSTRWAREIGFARSRNYLPSELGQRVVGATWHSAMEANRLDSGGHHNWWDQATRYQQIRRYASRSGLTDWVAIDDDAIGWDDADQRSFVQADGARGLSDRDTRARLRALLWASQALSR